MLIIQIIMPMVIAVILNYIENKQYLFILSLLTIIFNGFLVFYNSITQRMIIYTIAENIEIAIQNDPLSNFFIVLSSFLFFVTAIYAYGYFKKNHLRFYRYFLITLGIINGISLADNLITFYFFYEILTLGTLPLIIFYKNIECKYVGKKYVYFTMAGSTLVFIAMILFYSAVGHMDFVVGGVINGATDNVILTIAFLLMFFGFGIRSALVPFHSWLPASMIAPTPVSSLLDSLVAVKTGVFALMRISYFLFGFDFLQGLSIGGILKVIIILTIIMGSFLAFHSKHLKRRLAYSTIAQLGYILLGVVFFNKASFLGAIMHLANHAMLKIVLFFIIGVLIKKYDIEYLDQVDGIGKEANGLMGVFTIVSLSLIGIPPLNGFTSKWLLSIGVLESGGNVFFVMILLFGAFITAAYLLPIVSRAFFKTTIVNYSEKDTDTKIMNFAIYFMLLVNLVVSIYPNFVLNYIRHAILRF